MKLYQLRKPVKPILYCLLLTLATTATLVFSLQTLLDGLILENAAGEYAYVGTVYPINGDSPMMQPISQEVTERLFASENVTDFEKVDIRAAKITSASTVPDYMMTMDHLNQHYFAEVTVSGNQTPPQDGELIYGYNTLLLNKQWGSKLISRNSVTLNLARSAKEPALTPGSRLFLIGNYFIMNGSVRTDYMSIATPGALELMGQGEYYAHSPLRQTPIFEIPQELSPEESEAYILEKMEETGILSLYEKYKELNGAVTVRCVSDMSMIPYMAKGKLYIDRGRQLFASDKGKKVCVVSQGLMLRNRLVLGDTISLSLADGCYTIGEGKSGQGWESGFPMEEDELLTYAPAEEYEIVGFYHQLGRDTADPFFCSINDIFIPVQEETETAVYRPYTFSFRVPGDKHEAFLEEMEGFLEGKGYRLQMVDNGWEDVADSFYAMKDRQTLTLVCAVLCFMAAALSFGGLIFHHYRYEYGLCRLLGAYKKEAKRVYFGGFWLSGLPGAVVSVLCTWLVYIKWMRQAAFEAAPITMPSDLQCMGLLSLWAVAVLLVAAVFMGLLMKRSENKGILGML